MNGDKDENLVTLYTKTNSPKQGIQKFTLEKYSAPGQKDRYYLRFMSKSGKYNGCAALYGRNGQYSNGGSPIQMQECEWIDNNGGAIVNGGTISIAGCGTFALSIIDGCGIQNDGMIDNKEYGRINLSGMIDNGNYINNHGVITIGRDYQDNPGTIDNRGTIDNGGLIDNDGTIANKEFERNGFIFNGVINNDGVIKSDGTIDNVTGNAIEPRG